MTHNIMKPSLMFAGFFALFYLEPIPLGGVAFAVLWKSVLIAALVVAILLRHKGAAITSLTLWGGLFALEGLFNQSLFDDPVNTISVAIKQTYIPILYGFWVAWLKFNQNGPYITYAWLTRLALFVILSTLPFHLGLISPLSTGYDLSVFQLEGAGFVGLFQNSPVASITLGMATLVIVFHIAHVRLLQIRIFYGTLIVVGVVSTALTLSRTGFAVFLGGLLLLLFISRKKAHVLLGSAMIIAIVLGGYYVFETSDLFRMRILGINAYTIEPSSDQLGSGRTTFWESVFGYFLNADLFEQMFGFGPSGAMERMYQAVNQRIYAHNGFIDVLQFGGYLGLALYIMFLYHILKVTIKARNQRFIRPLAYAIFASYVIQNLLQGERVFLADLMLSLCLATVRLSYGNGREISVLPSSRATCKSLAARMIVSPEEGENRRNRLFPAR